MHNNTTKEKISILTCVRNESSIIKDYISNMISQEIVDFNLVIIDDHSTDNTISIVKDIDNEFVEIYSSQNQQGKKQAFEFGINSIQQGKILLTDADCVPASSNWVQLMSSKLDEHEIVLGYAPHFKEESIINMLQRYDNAWIASNYFGYAIQGIPYMGVGRNMAIHKETYARIKNKIKGKQLISGDDDLLVQAADPLSIGIITSPESFMYSPAEKTYVKWLRQKNRQIKTSSKYKFIHQILLAYSAIDSIFLLPLLILYTIIYPNVLSVTLLLIFLVTNYLIKGQALRKLKQEDLIPYIPILDILYSFHLVILSFYSLTTNQKSWK